MKNQTAVSPNYTAAIDDYLKAIYFVGREHGVVTTSLLATYLGFTSPSVTGMVQKLAKPVYLYLFLQRNTNLPQLRLKQDLPRRAISRTLTKAYDCCPPA